MFLRVALTRKQAQEIAQSIDEGFDADIIISARQLAAPASPEDDLVPISAHQADTIRASVGGETGRGKPVRLVIPYDVLVQYEDQIGNGILDSIGGFFKSAVNTGSAALARAKTAGRSAARTVANAVMKPNLPPPRRAAYTTPWDPRDLSGFQAPKSPVYFGENNDKFNRAMAESEATKLRYGMSKAARTPLPGVPAAWNRTPTRTDISSRADDNF
jgi:hypothetical protein